jgi:hypothetical protein
MPSPVLRWARGLAVPFGLFAAGCRDVSLLTVRPPDCHKRPAAARITKEKQLATLMMPAGRARVRQSAPLLLLPLLLAGWWLVLVADGGGGRGRRAAAAAPRLRLLFQFVRRATRRRDLLATSEQLQLQLLTACRRPILCWYSREKQERLFPRSTTFLCGHLLPTASARRRGRRRLCSHGAGSAAYFTGPWALFYCGNKPPTPGDHKNRMTQGNSASKENF